MVNYGLGSNADSLIRAYVSGSHVGVDAAISELRAAQAEQQMADAEAKRLDNATIGVRAQEAKLDEIRANIATVRARLNRLSLRAPVDGVVLTEQLDRLADAYVRPGDQILEIGDPGSWRAVILVREDDVHDVRPGDSVSIDVPALRELQVERLLGLVAAVGATPAAALSSGESPVVGASASGAYRVTIFLDPRQLRTIGVDRFRRGYSATAKIVTRRSVILRLVFERASNEFRRRTDDIR
jgi:multidrug resistance efflux pump